MAKAHKEKDFYSLKEVADILGVSVRSLYRYIDDEKLRAVKVGYWRVYKEDLDKFLRKVENIRTQK